MSARRYGQPWTRRWGRLEGLPPLLVAQLDDSPLVCLPLNETAGTTAADASGNGRNGTYTGATLGQAAIAPGAGGSATMGKVEIAYASWMQQSALTIEVLCYPTAVSSYQGVATRDDESSDRNWAFRLSAGTSNALAWNASSSLYQANGGTAVSTGTAYLLAMRYDPATNKLSTWKNGSKWIETTSSGNARPGTVKLVVGCGSTGGGYAFAGRMSNAAYYGTALSDTRILAHAQAAGLA